MKAASILAGLAALAACGARTPTSTRARACAEPAPACVARPADPCGAPAQVQAVCDEAARAFVCPPGARPYARAADSPGVCRPFTDVPGASQGSWGLSSVVRIPTEDGRCLWVAESVTGADGAARRNVAFEPDLDAPFGTCPTTSKSAPTPIVTMEGGGDPDVLVQLAGGYRLAGQTHAIYRLFRRDPGAAFGVTELGGGVARWDAASGRVVIPSAPFPWGLDLDLGDAIFVPPADPSHALVWGCAAPSADFVEACALARLDARGAVEILAPGNVWTPGASARAAAPQFVSGPWISAVAQRGAGALVHVYVPGFGVSLETHVASAPTGPWTDGAALGRCDLPAADPNAFCAGPVVHDELRDPLRPRELVVGYGVGSTGPAAGGRLDRWPRLVWVP